MQTAKTAEGEPVILMTLKGGVELPLVFKAESLSVLIAELQGLDGVAPAGIANPLALTGRRRA